MPRAGQLGTWVTGRRSRGRDFSLGARTPVQRSRVGVLAAASPRGPRRCNTHAALHLANARRQAVQGESPVKNEMPLNHFDIPNKLIYVLISRMSMSRVLVTLDLNEREKNDIVSDEFQ